MQHFDKVVKAVINPPCFAPKGTGFPEWIVKPLANYEVPLFKNAKLATDFRGSDQENSAPKKLRPIFLNAGAYGNISNYSATCMTFASQGYVCFGIYTQNES